MRNFLEHAFKIKENQSFSHKELVDNNMLSKGLIFLKTSYRKTKVIYTDTRAIIEKYIDFKIEKDFVIDIEILKKDEDFKKCMKSKDRDYSLSLFTEAIKNNEEHFDYSILSKYANFKERFESFIKIDNDNSVNVGFIGIYDRYPVQDFIECLQTSKYFDSGILKFTQDNTTYTKEGIFTSELEYLIAVSYNKSFSFTMTHFSYKTLPTYRFDMKGVIYKNELYENQILLIDCQDYLYYVLEY